MQGSYLKFSSITLIADVEYEEEEEEERRL
jgi:hypothetical protein